MRPNTTPFVPPWRGFGPLVVLSPLVLMLSPPEWPRWVLMWAMAFAIYCGCKWLTWRRTPTDRTLLWQHLAYLFAWPGMDARAFLKPACRERVQAPARWEWLLAASKTVIGWGLLFGLSPLIPESQTLVRGWVGMIGLILLLHFGSFHLLSCGWRLGGVNALPLMNRPLVARSVSEFWGERWNTAFRDLTHRFLFRPLTKPLGPRTALLAGFLVSGLVHELVITVPANGGYGGPTGYFVGQAVALLFERSRISRQLGLGQGYRGWLFTMFSVAAPVGVLFPPAFVERVIVPLINAVLGL